MLFDNVNWFDKGSIGSPASSIWAIVSMGDGLVYEGLVVSEAPYGLYLSIGGDSERLSLFPWHTISRVSYSNRG